MDPRVVQQSLADDRLVEQSLRGDEEAFGQLAQRYQDGVCQLSFSFTEVWEEAEDLAQETFIKAYLGLATLQDPSRFRTWLYRIAHREALNWRRGGKEESLSPEAAQRLRERERGNPSAEDFFLVQEERREVWDAVQSLPDRFRLPVVLRYYQEFSYAEIAAVLKISEAAVDARLRQAKKRLRKKLVGEFPEG